MSMSVTVFKGNMKNAASGVSLSTGHDPPFCVELNHWYSVHLKHLCVCRAHFRTASLSLWSVNDSNGTLPGSGAWISIRGRAQFRASFPQMTHSLCSQPLDLSLGAMTTRALSDVFEQFPSTWLWWAVQIWSDLFSTAPDINAISQPSYHGNISPNIRLNKWLSSTSPPPLFFVSFSLCSELPSPILALPAPKQITLSPQGPGLHNRVGSRPSYLSRIA